MKSYVHGSLNPQVLFPARLIGDGPFFLQVEADPGDFQTVPGVKFEALHEGLSAVLFLQEAFRVGIGCYFNMLGEFLATDPAPILDGRTADPETDGLLDLFDLDDPLEEETQS